VEVLEDRCAPAVITEFSAGISANSQPVGITSGPDGNLWFTEIAADKIGRITVSGTVTEFGVSAGSGPRGITSGPDGNLWFAEFDGNRIGRITPTGTVTEFSAGISADGLPESIVAGPDGNLWFTEEGGNRIGRITATGTVTEFSVGTEPISITVGPDGNLWFTEWISNEIGRITPTGTVTEFSTGITTNSRPFYITVGPDNNLWFTEYANRIGRITPTGTVTEFSAGISAGSGPTSITAGPDGNLWFTEQVGNQIGRITPSGTVTEFSVPTGSSIPYTITVGSDSNLWFTEYSGNQIGRLALVTLKPTIGMSGGGTVADGSTGTLTFTRTGDTTTALAVGVTMAATNTALLPSEYALTGAAVSNLTSNGFTVNFAPGDATKKVNFNATGDTVIGEADPNETATFNLASGGYTIDSNNASASVTIPANGTIVTNTKDSGEGSLRQALLNANAGLGNTIRFSISTKDPGFIDANANGSFDPGDYWSIKPLSALPFLNVSGVMIDGRSEGVFQGLLGYQGPPLIELDGASAGSAVSGLTINKVSNDTIDGLAINRFTGDGIDIKGPFASGNLIEGNFIGTDNSGKFAFGNSGDGVQIVGAANNTIGGTASGAGNLISGNGFGSAKLNGVDIMGAGASGNWVAGNTMGADVTGSKNLYTAFADVFIGYGAANNTVGGIGKGAGNLLTSTFQAGVFLFQSGTTGNIIQGNTIGLNATATAALSNPFGVELANGAANNTVGGTFAGAGNLISGNTLNGVEIDGAGTSGNIVQGNTVGTNAAGTATSAFLRNGWAGVFVGYGATDNTVGGVASGARNVLSNNVATGVEISESDSTGNVVQGNKLGTDPTGSVAVGNGISGALLLDTSRNTIGGTTAAAGNLISGNNVDGIDVMSVSSALPCSENVIEGNSIGTNATGSTALANAWAGVFVGYGKVINNTIGGTATGAGNVISGNAAIGIQFFQAGATGNVVEGNHLGTNAAGNAKLGNFHGIWLVSGAAGNTIGGTATGAGNVISGNGGDGIVFESSGTSGNVVQGNIIGSNTLAPNSGLNLANGSNGVELQAGTGPNTVGGSVAGANRIVNNIGQPILDSGSGDNTSNNVLN
jgi:streptogramin lyase